MAASKKPLISAVVSDLDGTLIDYEGASHAALEEPLVELGLVKVFSWELHADIVGRKPLGPEGWATIILEKLGIGADRLTPERYAELYFKSVEKKYAAIKEMDGASAFLEFCAKNGVPVAIATSSPRDSFDKKMKSHPNILDLVQVVVCGDDPEVKRGKPFPDIFELALQRLIKHHSGGGDEGRDESSSKSVSALSIPAGEVLALEDSPYGVQAAVAAGFAVAAFPDPRLSERNAAKFESAGPTWIFPEKGGLRKLEKIATYRSPLR